MGYARSWRDSRGGRRQSKPDSDSMLMALGQKINSALNQFHL